MHVTAAQASMIDCSTSRHLIIYLW